MRILVGSTALVHYIDIKRQPKDIDFFSDCGTPLVEGDYKIESFSHPELSRWFEGEERNATLDELYTIKVSHIFWDLKNNSWNKHCYDIMKMQEAGANLDLGLYAVLYKIWEERYGKKKANLNQSPEDFFNKSVSRVYDHDSIHHSIAYYDRPLFESILRDGSAVAVDVKKWDDLSLEDKFKTVREEVYATALERQLIPSDYTASPRGAYSWALKKTITSFSKGWFALFIATHLDELWKPDIDYVKRHKDNADKLIKLEDL